jgi:hydroxypyruvate reductase
LVAAGETAVTLGERWGEGGRCSHLAAAVALELQDVDGFALVAAGSDGRDGNSRAAGAVVDGGSAARAQAAGRPVGGALKAFDTAAAIREAGDIVETGATGTNVGDLVVATVEAGA